MSEDENLKPDGLRRLWGRRQSFKLSARQEQLFQTLLPQLQITLADHSVPGSIDPISFFDGALGNPPAFAGEVDAKRAEGAFHSLTPPFPAAPDLPPKWGRRQKRVSLEVGFGGGEHLAQWAKTHPDDCFIGAEHFINGLAKMLTHIEEEKLSNIRLFAGDARRLVGSLKDASLERVFILFPDPWPKKRHHKRRYVRDDTLIEIARVLTDGGMLRIASDIPDYIDWTLEHMARRPEFARTSESVERPHARPPDWPPTRYEQKAIREGRIASYLDYRRLSA